MIGNAVRVMRVMRIATGEVEETTADEGKDSAAVPSACWGKSRAIVVSCDLVEPFV
jgi:hypothetical protein